MIKLRLDVDYAYPSRPKSFLFTFLKLEADGNYLKNSKIIAKMVNESEKEVKAYWFFTPYTLPDEEMLALMHNNRHEAALHVAVNPYQELNHLEKITNQKIAYYTIHGTERRLARLIWGRKLSQSRVPIPEEFPLKNFWQFPTLSLDLMCRNNSVEKATEMAEKSTAQGHVLHIHPDWLFHSGTFNRRGRYYEVLKNILDTDKDFDYVVVRKKTFAKIASRHDVMEYARDVVPTEYFLKKLAERGIDVFTFIERNCCFNLTAGCGLNWVKTKEYVGLLRLGMYKEWWVSIGKKTRNMVRKAEKCGIVTSEVEASETLAKGIWRIYNETPIRQGRGFSRYGQSLESVSQDVMRAENSTFVGAFLQDELVGFIQLVHGDKIDIVSQILSMQRHWDKAVNNALLAKSIEGCAERQIPWIMYGRMGNHPSLDVFKESNSFQKYTFTRYFVPLTRRGRIVVRLGLQRDLKDALPSWLKQPLFPVYNWMSRTRMKIRLLLRSP